MEHLTRKLFGRFLRMYAFVLASIQVARDHRGTLEERVEDAEGPLEETLLDFVMDVERWLGKAEAVIARLLEVGKRVGVAIEKARAGRLEGDAMVRRLLTTVEEQRRDLDEEFLERVGREPYRRANRLAEELTRNPDRLRGSGELEELQDEFEEIDALLEDGPDSELRMENEA